MTARQQWLIVLSSVAAVSALAVEPGCSPVPPESLDAAALDAARGDLLLGAPLVVQRCIDNATYGHWNLVWDVRERDGNWREFAVARCSGFEPPTIAEECRRERRIAIGLDDDTYIVVGHDITIATVRALAEALAHAVQVDVRTTEVDYVAVPGGGAWSAGQFGYDVSYVYVADAVVGHTLRLVAHHVDGDQVWIPADATADPHVAATWVAVDSRFKVQRDVPLALALELRDLARPLLQTDEFVDRVGFASVTDGGRWEAGDEGYWLGVSRGNSGRHYRFVERCTDAGCRLQLDERAVVSQWYLD